MFKDTQERKLAVLKAIQNEEYDNWPIAKELGVLPLEISHDKQTLYHKDFIDRGFGHQRWILTDLGEHALKHGFGNITPTEELKLILLNHIHNTTNSLEALAKRNHLTSAAFNYHKKWLVKNGLIDDSTFRGTLTTLGIKALEGKSISACMVV